MDPIIWVGPTPSSTMVYWWLTTPILKSSQQDKTLHNWLGEYPIPSWLDFYRKDVKSVHGWTLSMTHKAGVGGSHRLIWMGNKGRRIKICFWLVCPGLEGPLWPYSYWLGQERVFFFFLVLTWSTIRFLRECLINESILWLRGSTNLHHWESLKKKKNTFPHLISKSMIFMNLCKAKVKINIRRQNSMVDFISYQT